MMVLKQILNGYCPKVLTGHISLGEGPVGEEGEAVVNDNSGSIKFGDFFFN